MPILRAVIEGPDITLDRAMVMVGRHPQCDARLDSVWVSRRHCILIEDGDEVGNGTEGAEESHERAKEVEGVEREEPIFTRLWPQEADHGEPAVVNEDGIEDDSVEEDLMAVLGRYCKSSI